MYNIGWTEYIRYSNQLAKSVQESGKQYKGILAIARGGTIVGTILSHVLDLPMAVIIGRSYGKDHSQKEVELSDIITMEPYEGAWLIVDDLQDSGKTIGAIREKHKEKHKVDFDVAVLFDKGLTEERPDFLIEVRNEWIIFPYERG